MDRCYLCGNRLCPSHNHDESYEPNSESLLKKWTIALWYWIRWKLKIGWRHHYTAGTVEVWIGHHESRTRKARVPRGSVRNKWYPNDAANT